ncbi:MAG: hypothetical protein Q9167_007682 [Letrouitia subvulpina]
MAFPLNSLRAFLSHAKSNLSLALGQSKKITFVVGNESADLDSFTSSILYAYIRSLAPPHSAFTPLYIPLLNIPASDINLRPEFSALCHHANISTSHLITLDNLPPLSKIQQELKPEYTRWILVDHNDLQGTLGRIYAHRVLGVIDHHSEEFKVPQNTDPEPRIIEKCGSCTSLVTQALRSSWDASTSSSLSSSAGHAQGNSLSDDGVVVQTWNAQVAKFALGSILVDTSNMKAESKVEQADIDAVEYLETKVNLSPGNASWSRKSFYKEINTAQKDIGHLSFKDILRKDYKQWIDNSQTLGISSVVKPLQFLIEKATNKSSPENNEEIFVTAVGDFMVERNLTIFAIMTHSKSASGEFRRELLLQATSPGHSAASRILEKATPTLELENLTFPSLFPGPGAMQPSSEGPWRKMWLQKDTSKSRKQVAPLLREVIQSCDW